MSDVPRGSQRLAVRVFKRVKRRQLVATQVLTGIHDGLWLGAFSPEFLHHLDAAYYDDKGQYVDERYNRSGLHEWESGLVERHVSSGARIAVTGAGGGREVLALLERGFDAMGFEPHPQLAAAGARFLADAGHPDRLTTVARDSFPGDGAWDAVLVGWGSYMLIPGRARRVAFLQAARSCLAPGAPLLLSFFVREGTPHYFRWVARTAGPLRTTLRREPVDEGDALVPNYAHHFTEATLAVEAQAAGFEVLEYHPQPYGHAALRAV